MLTVGFSGKGCIWCFPMDKIEGNFSPVSFFAESVRYQVLCIWHFMNMGIFEVSKTDTSYDGGCRIKCLD
jgi:hypothetical protein